MKVRAPAWAVVLLFAAPAARAQMTVSAVRETLKIRPMDPVPAAQSSISLSCAQNEFCAFQVEVSAGASAVTVNGISLGDLAGPGSATLAGASALVYREGFMDITTASNTAGATGEWPDPLIPNVDDFYQETRNAFPVTVPAGTNQPFWVEIHIPNPQTAGSYSGTATVTPSTGSAVLLTVNIQVRGFALPSTSSLPSAYGFGWDGPCQGSFGGYGPPNCDDQQLEALNALYFQDALNHRLSISALVYAPPIADGGGSWTTFDTLYGPFLDGTALTGSDQLQGAQLTEIAFSADDNAPANFAAWASHFQANGWYGKLFDYTCDEPPNGCAWSDIPTIAAEAHAGDPNFRTLVTTDLANATTNNVLSSIDILVPIINYMYDENTGASTRASYDSFLSQPNSFVWMYQSCEPSSSCSDGSVGTDIGYPTIFIDESAVTNRMMQWMDFEYQVGAELYYDTTYAMENGNAWQTQYEFGNNGDGSIWYPGTPAVIGGTDVIPIESFRMKMLREGMQDYEYLNLLVQLGDSAFAQAQLATVVTAANSFAASPTALEAARLAMATEIEADLAASSTGGTSSGGSSSSSSSGGSSSGGVSTTRGTSSGGGSSGSSKTSSSHATTSSGTSGAGSSSGGSKSSVGGSTGGSSASSTLGASGTSGSSGSAAASSAGGTSSSTSPPNVVGGCSCGSGGSPAAALPWLLLSFGLLGARRRSRE
jgi:uncharacterized protein (TIGR03382 family)